MGLGYENCLAVYSPTGKGELTHDLDVLLSEAARIIQGNPHGGVYDEQWIINGETPERSTERYARNQQTRQILIGSVNKWRSSYMPEEPGTHYKSPVQVYFDAVEVVESGKVYWRQCHDGYVPRLPFLFGQKGDLFTGPELLMRLADALIHQRGCLE